MAHNNEKDKKAEKRRHSNVEPHHGPFSTTAQDLFSPEDDISSIGSDDMIDNSDVPISAVPKPYMFSTAVSQMTKSPVLLGSQARIGSPLEDAPADVEEAYNILPSLKEAMAQKDHEEAGKLWDKAREDMWRWLVQGYRL